MNPTSGVLSEAWTHYKEYWSHLLPVALVIYLAVAVAAALLTAVGDIGVALAGIVSFVGVLLVQAAIVRAVEDVRDGRADLSLGETYARARPHLLSIAGIALLFGLGFFVLAGLLVWALGLIGLLILLVAMAGVFTLYCVVVPVIVLEDRGPGAALQRSPQLVSPYFLSVLGVVLLTFLIWVGLNLVLSLLFGFLPEGVEAFLRGVVGGSVWASFAGLIWTLLYYRLQGAGGTTEGAGGPGSPLPPAT